MHNVPLIDLGAHAIDVLRDVLTERGLTVKAHGSHQLVVSKPSKPARVVRVVVSDDSVTFSLAELHNGMAGMFAPNAVLSYVTPAVVAGAVAAWVGSL